MSTLTLEYIVPRNNQPLSVQTAALLGVALQSPTANNELDKLGNIAESAPRNVAAVVGPPPRLSFTLTYASTAAFDEYYPTASTQIAALTNLWTQRLSLLLRTTVTASTPVITP
jgi:hypothetical protein